MNFNPKWQMDFLVATLNIKNVVIELQQSWSKQNAPATDDAAQVRDQNTGGSDVGNNNTEEMLPMQRDKAAY